MANPEAEPEAAALLTELAEALHTSALPADVVEARLAAAASALGLEGQFFTLQSFFAMEVGAGGAAAAGAGRRVAIRRIAFDTHWNLARMSALLDLSAAIAERRIEVGAARATIREIALRTNLYPKFLVVLCYAIYGAAVAARVGGRWTEMFVAGLVGMVAGGIHFGTLRSHTIDLQKTFLAALLGSLAAFLLGHVFPPFDQARAIFGGTTLLVPAMVVTIGVHELANDELESGVVRLTYGLLRFVMLAAGVTAALTLVGARHWPPAIPATPLPALVVLAIVGVGGVALVFCLQGRRQDAPAIVGAVLLAYLTQELTKRAAGEVGAPLLSAFVVGAAAWAYNRWWGGLAAVVIVPGLLQLAPGFLGNEAVLRLLRGDAPGGGGESFFRVLVVAVELATGLLLANLLLRRRPIPMQT